MGVLLQGGQVFQNGTFQVRDVLIDDEGVVRLGDNLQGQSPRKVVDITGKYVLPGLADIHVHLREPGFSYKETVASGTLAAARGGFTAVGAMPNLDPPPDNLPELLKQIEHYREDALVEVFPYANMTTGGTGWGQPYDYAPLAPYVIGFTDDGFGVQKEETMRQVFVALAEIGAIASQHTEDLELSGEGYIHDGEYASRHGHVGKPSESEWKQVERDLRLVEETGCDYHVQHISSAESVELVRQAKAKGLPVTAETAPHYLALSDSELQEDGRFRMNPPIRSERDRDAVIAGLLDGTIDMVATDHAPHSAEEKGAGLTGSANGVVGIENSLAVIYTYFVKPEKISMERLVELMSTNPRERFRLGGGTIRAGELADLVVFDPQFVEPLNPDKFVSKGKATPFAGIELNGQVDLTMCQGDPVWDPQGYFQ